jgi:hypothetical protein
LYTIKNALAEARERHPNVNQRTLQAVAQNILREHRAKNGPRFVDLSDLSAAEKEELKNPTQTYKSLSRPKIGPSRE